MAGYLKNSLSPSEAEKIIEQFDPTGSVTSPFLESFDSKFPTVDQRVQEVYENGLQGSDTVDGYFDTDAAPATPPAAGGTPAWTFITAPEDVSWDTSNQANRIDMFGTNNPPVVAGSRGMRDLTLGNALVEGFLRNVAVEDKVAALEALMNYQLNASDGFVKVPVYQVKANDKAYGNGYFIIRDVKVKEAMRDLKGNATRAYVDISLMQVPEYQVNSGRDLASKPAASAKALALPDPKATAAAQAAGQKASVTSNVDKNLQGKEAGPKGPSTPTQPAAEKPPAPKPNTGTRIRGVSRTN